MMRPRLSISYQIRIVTAAFASFGCSNTISDAAPQSVNAVVGSSTKDQANSFFQKGVEAFNAAMLAYNQGNFSVYPGKFNEANEAFLSSLQMHPNSICAYNLSVVSYYMKDGPNAIKYARLAEIEDPNLHTQFPEDYALVEEIWTSCDHNHGSAQETSKASSDLKTIMGGGDNIPGLKIEKKLPH